MGDAKVRTVPIRERILASFEEPAPTALVEFSKYIANLDADFVICMARKAARLLDLLALAGLPTPKRPLVYHHILDQDLSRFSGKSVVLVDDTLILGTTLGRAEKRLVDAGVRSISTVVFAADTEHWERELVRPEKVFLELNHQEALAFCSAEVRALAQFSIPYLTDFPISREIQLSRPRLNQLQSIYGWETAPLTLGSPSPESGITFSSIPTNLDHNTVKKMFGANVGKLVTISKVRAFARKSTNGAYWTRFVPIVTIAPLEEAELAKLFEAIVSTIERIQGKKFEGIRREMNTSISRLRFVQYILSTTVGLGYLERLQGTLGLKRQVEFSLDESVRLFGNWLRQELSECHAAMTPGTVAHLQRRMRRGQILIADLPQEVAEVSRNECEQYLESHWDGVADKSESSRTLRTDLEQIFVKLYQRHEPAARAEVGKYKQEIFEIPAKCAPHRDRLKFGFDWGTIADLVLTREKLKPTPHRRLRLSFFLDSLVDAGIAVPILCERDGVVFRAYRYGEDVPFANQEAALAYDLAKGFLEGSQKASIPRLTFQKLLVALLRVGVAKKFLWPTHSMPSLGGGVARVGFHLHGSVATMPADESLLADHQDAWLSRYLVDTGVMRHTDGQFGLNERPEASPVSLDAPDQAEQLGFVLGQLYSDRTESGDSVLSETDLVILTTCSRPRDTAVALAAELNLIMRYSVRLPHSPAKDNENVLEQHNSLVNNYSHLAIHSARMKFLAYRDDSANEIIERCASRLAIKYPGPLGERYWNTVWRSVRAQAGSEESVRFSPLILKLFEQITRYALLVCLMEIALTSWLAIARAEDGAKLLKRAYEKTSQFLDSAPKAVQEDKLFARLKEIVASGTPIEKSMEAMKYAVKHLGEQEQLSRSMLRQVLGLARSYGRADERTDYQYVVWYDVVDSTGQKSDLKGDSLRRYRESVRAFKQAMEENVGGLIANCRGRSIEVYPWANTLSSRDDEKNIFFRGPGARNAVATTVLMLYNQAIASPVRVRVVVLETTFAGEAAHKYSSEPDVAGEAFWEHSSRLKQSLKEKEYSERQDVSYFWFASHFAGLAKTAIPEAQWVGDIFDGNVEATIENFPLSTRVVGGAVKSSLCHAEHSVAK